MLWNFSILFQYSSVLFDSRIELIVEMTRSNISPQLHAKLPSNFMHCGACQTISCTHFSMLRKLLVKDHHFSLGNVCKYLTLYVNESLSTSLSFKNACAQIQLFTANFVKIDAYFSRFYCNKNLP